MDWQKSAYIGGIVALSLILLFKWNEFQEARDINLINSTNNSSVSKSTEKSNKGALPLNQLDETIANKPKSSDIIAPPESNSTNDSVSISEVTKNTSRYIQVYTDTLTITIDLVGGDITKVDLPNYKIKLNRNEPITLLDNTKSNIYISQSGLIGPNATDTRKSRPRFKSTKNEYHLENDSLIVDITTTDNDVNITKRFEFLKNDYFIKVNYIIDNQSDSTWQAQMYGRIVRDNYSPPAAADSGFGVSPYLGAATTSEDKKYWELTFSDIEKEKQKFTFNGGWIAMVQHYFISAWVPDQNEENEYFLQKVGKNYLLGYTGPMYTADSGQRVSISSGFYVGPKDMDRLEDISDNLDLTLDFSFLWWIAKPLFHLLDFLHSFIGNWGWSIIALTIIIKLIFFYPSAMSYRSMARMRKVSPKMQELKERCGDDKQKLSQEMMKLYKKEKVNPMGGCLPILIQMPVFIALYWVLMESVELRHAPFIFWIKDLSVMDPYFVLPLLMGGTMYIQQKLNPTPPDPMQAKIMQWMPVAFTFLFLWFPAGLVVYWVTNNTLSIIQQYLITRKIENSDS